MIRIQSALHALCWLHLGIGALVGCSSGDKSRPDAGSPGYVAGNVSIATGGTNAGNAGTGTAGDGRGTTGTGGAIGSSTGGVQSAGGMSGGGSSGTAGGMMDASVNPGPDAGTSMMDANTGAAGTGSVDSGSATGDDAGDMCMPPAKPLSTGNLAKCPTDVCPAGDSVCVPRTLLDTLKVPTTSIDLLADCDSTQKCVPAIFVAEVNRFTLPTCRSLNNAEGRCLSSCVPQVAAEASLLPKDICTGTDLCAPCFDPRTGENTHACEQGCDPGPSEPAKPFAHCCSNRGLCVPPALAGDQAPNLLRDTCDAASLCAPTELTDPKFKPVSCNSLEGVEGRCISTCVGGAVAKQRDRLPTAGCGTNEVCAPCYDPVTGDDTGACRINGDVPAQAKKVFVRCCDNGAGTKVGVCVLPETAGNQASMLRQDTCAQGKLCAPILKAEDPSAKFPSCTGLGTGACVPSCIIDPLQAAILSRVTCAQGELCSPCSILGQSTGACD